MTTAVDASNYTDRLTTEALAAWKAAGVVLVIVQAVDPPAGFPASQTRWQIQACLDAGLAVDAYVWLWFDLDVTDIQRKLALLEGLPIRRLWLDVEDQSAARYDQATCEAKVADALNACDALPVTGSDKTGIYTGRWFWTDSRYMGGTTAFSDRELWSSDYDGVADTTVGIGPYSGWQRVAIKQHVGTSSLGGVGGIDQNALSAEELAKVTGGVDVTDEERQEMQNTINSLVSSLGYLSLDLLAPVVKQKSPVSKAIKTLVAGIRAQADAHGIDHA